MLMGPTFSLLSTLNMSTCIIPWELVNATMKLVNLGLQVFELFLIFNLKSPPRICEAKNLAVQLIIDCGFLSF